MCGQLTEVQKKLIEEIADREGFKSYKIETETIIAKDEGHNGEIVSVSLKDDQKTLELVVKSATKDPNQRNNPERNVSIRRTYQKEIYTYQRTLQSFDEFAKNMLLDYSGHPKFYGQCYDEGDECLVLQNMRKHGYKLWNQNKPMDDTHTTLVLKEYAKLHSISLAMKNKTPEVFQTLCEELSAYEPVINYETKVDFLRHSTQAIEEILKNNNSVTEKIHELFSDPEEIVSNVDKKPDEMLSVIVHGDSWCNNIMFKYEDQKNPDKPTKVCFVDWQLSEVDKPASEICYFLFICCGKDILSNHKKLFKIYTDAVIENLRRRSCNPEDNFSVDIFMGHWRYIMRYGIVITTGLLKVLLSGTPDEREAIYKQRVLDLVEFLNENI